MLILNFHDTYASKFRIYISLTYILSVLFRLWLTMRKTEDPLQVPVRIWDKSSRSVCFAIFTKN